MPCRVIITDSVAVQSLFTGARKIWSRSRQHNRYQKDRAFQQALQDSYSVAPREVQHYTYAKKVHIIGRSLTKLLNSENNAILTLFRIVK